VLLVIAAIGAMVIGRKTERPEDLVEQAAVVDDETRAQAGALPGFNRPDPDDSDRTDPEEA
jgi:hypothetical protein